MHTTTYETGELIKVVLDAGYRKIAIGVMSALGIKFLHKTGNLLRGIGAELGKIVDIDISKYI